METRNGHIVLIVDDSLLICEQIKASLKEENIFITEAHTGEEAEAMVKQYQPDLILLDVVLPDADGYTLFDRLKAVDQNGASILFLTSKDKDDDVVKGFSKGACDYIKKPFVRGELLSRVRAHLQLKQQIIAGLNLRVQPLKVRLVKVVAGAKEHGNHVLPRAVVHHDQRRSGWNRFAETDVGLVHPVPLHPV